MKFDRKRLSVFLAFFLTFAGAFAQADNADVIVCLDTSVSMFPYFDKVVDFVVSDMVKDYVRSGDTFHLLTFSDTAQLEIAAKIQKADSLNSLIARLYLLYPFGKNTDLVSAFNYLYQYTADLNEQDNKRIILITDGLNNPSAKSPYFTLKEDETLAAIEKISQDIVAKNWDFSVIRVPIVPGAGATPAANRETDTVNINPDKLFSAFKKELHNDTVTFSVNDTKGLMSSSLSLPRVSFPEKGLGKKTEQFSFPLRIKNTTNDSIKLELSQILLDNNNVLQKRVFSSIGSKHSKTINPLIALPDSLKNGQQKLSLRLVFSNAVRVVPSVGTIEFELHRNPFLTFARTYSDFLLIIGILVLLAILLIAIYVFVIKRLEHSKTASVVNYVTGIFSADEAAEAQQAAATAVGAKVAAPGGAAPIGAKGQEAAKASKADIMAAARAAGEKYAGKTGSAAPAIPAKKAEAQAAAEKAGKTAATAAESGKSVTNGVFQYNLAPTKEEIKAAKKAALKAQQEAIPQKPKDVFVYTEKKEPKQFVATKNIPEPRQIKPVASKIAVQLTVTEQNPNIGLRNVHTMGDTRNLSLGGKGADFTIFVVRVPRKIAVVSWNGEKLAFTPRYPEYFPQCPDGMADCLGQTIECVTPEGFTMRLRFDRWESATDKTNRLLHAIEIKGMLKLEV
jgi:hypothetical protein